MHTLQFESRAEALLYTEEQWEPEPAADASAEVYGAWEHRNPSWAMRSDLGVLHLDSDFVETIDGAEIDSYLAYHLRPEDVQQIQLCAPADANVLVLVFEPAVEGIAAPLSSTPRLSYCGEFDWNDA